MNFSCFCKKKEIQWYLGKIEMKRKCQSGEEVFVKATSKNNTSKVMT